MSAIRQVLGPVVVSGGRIKPDPGNAGSYLSQALLLQQLHIVAPLVGGNLLDVGCGTKPYAAIFEPYVKQHVGCDWPPDADAADRHAADAFGDAMSLPFRTGAFDSVVCTEVLEHLPEPVRCIQEMNRVLRPGGILVISVPFLYWVHEYPRDYFRYTPFGLRHLLEAHGFQVVRLSGRGGLPAVLADLIGKWAIFVIRRTVGRRPGRRAVSWLANGAILTAHLIFLGTRRAFLAIPGCAAVIRVLSLSELVSLGYVVVATKNATHCTIERPHPDAD